MNKEDTTALRSANFDSQSDFGQLMTSAEAARYLRVAEKTLVVWRCNKTYDIPYVKVGRCVRYRRSDLDKFITSRISR